MTYDLLVPAQLSAALLPDLLLMAGAMLLMLVAAWRPDSAAHQRTVGFLQGDTELLTQTGQVVAGRRGDQDRGQFVSVDLYVGI